MMHVEVVMVNGIVASLLVAVAAASQPEQAAQAPAAAIVIAPAGDTRPTPSQHTPPAARQDPTTLKAPESMNLSGPRLGVTFLSPGVVSSLRDDPGVGIDIGSVISQFGWQKEKRFYSGENGITAVTEWIFLFGGLDQGLVIPSFSWLVGLRSMKGVEFAVGPNLSPTGAAIAAAAGVTFRSGNLNFPVNLAVVPSKAGVRVSMLVGFNTRKR